MSVIPFIHKIDRRCTAEIAENKLMAAETTSNCNQDCFFVIDFVVIDLGVL